MESDRYLLDCLLRFKELVKEYALLCKQSSAPPGSDDWSDDNPLIKLRVQLNKLALPVKMAFRDAGLPFRAPIYLHGREVDVDLSTELFYLPEYEGFQGWHTIFDILERAIGLYELRVDTGMPLHEAATSAPAEEWRLIQIIEKALRPSFRNPPQDESHLQEVLRGILLAADVEFVTEHTVLFGATSVRPDFYIPESRIALEVKYLREGNLGRVVGQMGDDVVRYRGEDVRRILFLVYDNGQISDHTKFVTPFADFEDVRILVIKH